VRPLRTIASPAGVPPGKAARTGGLTTIAGSASIISRIGPQFVLVVRRRTSPESR